MKKIIILSLLFGLISIANAQLLPTATYTSVYKDTVTVNGTNGGSDWFTNSAGYNEIWVEIYNGAFWFTAKIDYPVQFLSKLSVYCVGADSSFMVAGYGYGGNTIYLPLVKSDYSPAAQDWIKNTYGWYKWRLNPTTAAWVQFRGFIRKND